MVAAAELPDEREVVFPKIAALAGMWVIDKQVWRIGRRQAGWLMPLAATAGRLIARIPVQPAPGDIAPAFPFTAGTLLARPKQSAPSADRTSLR